MIILGLFLIHLAATVVAFMFIRSLGRWLGGATMIEAGLTLAAAAGAVAAILILVAHGRKGVIITLAIVAFWSVAIFGASGRTAINIIALAGAALAIAAAAVVVESLVARRRERAARRLP